MALNQAPLEPTNTSGETDQAPGQYRLPLYILTSLFFMWGFLTALNDILIPHLKNVFDLTYTQSMLIQFCFFGAYFLVSVPAGSVVAKIGYQRGLVLGLLVAGLGCFLFYPAAGMQVYALFLAALFVLASGITILQVSANPYVTALGRPETASSRLTMTQAFNALGTTMAPLFGAALILSAVAFSGHDGQTIAEFKAQEANSVKVPYLALGGALWVLAFIMAVVNLPKIGHQSISVTDAKDFSLWQHSHLVLGAVAIFLYVGAEVAIGSFLVNFISDLGMSSMSEQKAAQFVSYYWGGALVGRFIGAWVMTKISAGRVLAFNATGSVALILLAVVSSGSVAMVAILAVGLCNSIMFPTIFSLAIKDLGAFTGRGSGVVCAAIVGGAIVPLVQGALADSIGLQVSFLLPAICYVFIIYYGLVGCKVKQPPNP